MIDVILDWAVKTFMATGFACLSIISIVVTIWLIRNTFKRGDE